MSIIAKDKGGNFDPCPAGNHIARCVGIIDLGTQSYEWQGKKTSKRKIRITWELPEEKKEFKPGEGEKPYLLSKEFGLSLSEKSDLRKSLQSWRGREFTQQELDGFAVEKVLSAPCMVNVVHQEKNGNRYANITSVTPLPKGIQCPDQINASVLFSLDAFSIDIFTSLNEFVQEKIKKSPEYQAIMDPSHFEAVPENGREMTDEDVPF